MSACTATVQYALGVPLALRLPQDLRLSILNLEAVDVFVPDNRCVMSTCLYVRSANINNGLKTDAKPKDTCLSKPSLVHRGGRYVRIYTRQTVQLSHQISHDMIAFSEGRTVLVQV